MKTARLGHNQMKRGLTFDWPECIFVARIWFSFGSRSILAAGYPFRHVPLSITGFRSPTPRRCWCQFLVAKVHCSRFQTNMIMATDVEHSSSSSSSNPRKFGTRSRNGNHPGVTISKQVVARAPWKKNNHPTQLLVPRQSRGRCY